MENSRVCGLLASGTIGVFISMFVAKSRAREA